MVTNYNNEPQERQSYIPASVRVIDVTSQRVICTSGDIDGFNVRNDDTDNW